MNIHEIIDGFEFPSSKNVYFPAEDSYLFLDYLDTDEFHRDFSISHQNQESFTILDMGCGTGILGICLAIRSLEIFRKHDVNRGSVESKRSVMLFSVDITPSAVEYFHTFIMKNIPLLYNKNILLPSEAIHSFAIESDLFGKLKKNDENQVKDLNKKDTPVQSLKFDIIIFNPPYLPSEKDLINTKNKKPLDHAWDGGDESGNLILLRFFSQARDYLKEKGEIYFITSNHSDIGSLLGTVASMGFESFLMQSVHIFFEDIMLFKAVLAR